MLSVKGTFENGVARPSEEIEGRDGQTVIITFVDDEQPGNATDEADWDELEQLLSRHTINTGIGDLAEQHDHYVHGKPKRP